MLYLLIFSKINVILTNIFVLEGVYMENFEYKNFLQKRKETTGNQLPLAIKNIVNPYFFAFLALLPDGFELLIISKHAAASKVLASVPLGIL